MSTVTFNSRFGAVLSLCRISNLPTLWMNVLTAAVLANSPGGTHGILAVLLLCFALSCFYCGGMALNDVCDIDYDSVHQRFRPIVAGRITLEQASAVMYTLFATGFLCLLIAPYRAGIAAGAALLAVIWVYDRFHKRHPSTVLAMASARLLAYVVTALALTDAVPGLVWVAGIVQAIYIVTLTFVARYESRMPGQRYAWPVVPWMLAAIPLCDGIVLAVLVHPAWLAAGVAGMALTRASQRYVRGD